MEGRDDADLISFTTSSIGRCSVSLICVARLPGIKPALRQSQTVGCLTPSEAANLPTPPAFAIKESMSKLMSDIVGQSYISCQLQNCRAFRHRNGRAVVALSTHMIDEPTPKLLTPGARLRALRRRHRIRQEDLAAAVGVSRPHVSMIENDRDLPGRETLAAFADYFRVSIDYILKGTDAPTDAPDSPKLVDDPDELAWLGFWKDLGEDERRLALFMLKRPPLPAVKAPGVRRTRKK